MFDKTIFKELVEFIRAEESENNKKKTVINITADQEDKDSDLDSSDDGFALQLSMISEVPTAIEDLDTIHVVEEMEVEMTKNFFLVLFVNDLSCYFFLIVQRKWCCLFSKLSFSIYFVYFLTEQLFSKILCSVKTFVQCKRSTSFSIKIFFFFCKKCVQ